MPNSTLERLLVDAAVEDWVVSNERRAVIDVSHEMESAFRSCLS
jgi:hypothetical protein